MEYQKSDKGYLVHLRRGEELFTSLLDFVRKEKLTSGWIQGLGGVDEVELGFYEYSKKEFLRQSLHEELELVQVVGNLTHFEKNPILHLHATLGDRQFKTYSGHLFYAKIGIVCELFVIPLSIDLQRSFDEEFQINLIDIAKSSSHALFSGKDG